MLRFLHTTTYISKNAMADFFLFVSRRPGYIHAHIPTLPIMMVRRVGVTTDLESSNRWLRELVDRLNIQNIPHVLITKKMVFEPTDDFVNGLKATFENLDPGFENLLDVTLKSFKFFKQSNKIACESISDTVVNGLFHTFSAFIHNETSMSKSKLVNFAIKLFYWIEIYYRPTLEMYNKFDLTSTFINPKFIYNGPISKSESYCFLLNYYLGLDSLYSHSEEDVIIKQLPLLEGYSQLEVLEKRVPYVEIQNESPVVSKGGTKSVEAARTVATPTVTPIAEPSTVPPTARPSAVPPVTKVPVYKQRRINPVIQVKFKAYGGLDKELEALLDPQTKRIGYIGMPSPILQTYFVRYIGVDQNLTTYKNRLVNFEKSIQRSQRYYKRYENHIPLETYQPALDKIALLTQTYSDVKKADLTNFVEQLNALSCLDFASDGLLRDQIYLALCRVLNLAFEGANSIPTQKVKNLVGKIVSWTYGAFDTLFKNFSYKQAANPLVLYYGPIKAHEALFLVFLFEVGVDILYVNPYEDNLFIELDPTEQFTTMKVLDTVSNYFDFPLTLSLERQETVAYQASEEINQIIHSQEGGIFKPWQFENFKTQPVTLKATYDEVKILWHEEARMRTGFKIVNDSVFIPNFFVKIVGTEEDISSYWRDVKHLAKGPLTLFFTKFPFTSIRYQAQDLKAIEKVMMSPQKLNREKLKTSVHYPYGYLSHPIQNQMMDKIEALLSLPIIKTGRDPEFPQKVVKSILMLGKPFIEMIQQFDYPTKIPKLVVYSADDSLMTQEDAITLSFLYLMGFDICIITPTAYNNIENFVDQDYFDVFSLPKKQFQLVMPDLNRLPKGNSKPFWESFWGKPQ